MTTDTPLCKIGNKYGADKAPKMGKHTYTPYYYKLLASKRNKIKKILEIGVGSGASLRMWRDYFPNATVYGADYRQDFLFNEDRIKTFLCDQRRQTHLESLVGKIGNDIDVVIDDASHRPRDQVYTCIKLMPMLARDVIYIIEDVADPTIAKNLSQLYDTDIPPLPTFPRYDNRLIVVKNKPQLGLSFFAKNAFAGRDGHLQRVSSIIRGEQISTYLGAKLNPEKGYNNDVCVYVKPPYKKGQNFVFEGKNSYLDIVDEIGYVELLRKHPHVGVISLSRWNYKILQKLLSNKIVNIPQHHCNYERQVGNNREIKRVGIIGVPKAFEYLPPDLESALNSKGIEFIKYSNFTKRDDVVNFYLNIDVQIVWRPFYNYQKDILANPLKIVNASSFGIPSICYDEPVFSEMEGCYLPVHTQEELLEELNKLRTQPKLREGYRKKCLERAEEYHIEKISTLYKNLL